MASDLELRQVFSRNLCAIMAEMDVSQAVLGRIIGIDRMRTSRYLAKATSIRLHDVINAASAFGLEVKDLTQKSLTKKKCREIAKSMAQTA